MCRHAPMLGINVQLLHLLTVAPGISNQCCKISKASSAQVQAP